MTAEKAALGRMLFDNVPFSPAGTRACVSCHTQDRAFIKGRPVTIGIHGASADAMRSAKAMSAAGRH